MFIYSEPLSGICAYYIFIRGGQVGMELVRPWLEETTLVSGREAKDYWRIWKKKSYVITKNSSMGNDFLFLKMNSSTGEMVLGGKQGLWIRERCIASLLFLVSRLLTCNTSSSKHCFLYDLSFCSLLSAQSKRPAQLCHSVRHLLL